MTHSRLEVIPKPFLSPHLSMSQINNAQLNSFFFEKRMEKSAADCCTKCKSFRKNKRQKLKPEKKGFRTHQKPPSLCVRPD